MNERMSDLLDLASEDDGAALGFNGDTVVRRAGSGAAGGRGIAIGLAAAGVAGVRRGRPRSSGVSRGPTPRSGRGPSTHGAAALLLARRRLRSIRRSSRSSDRCARLAPAAPVRHESPNRHAGGRRDTRASVKIGRAAGRTPASCTTGPSTPTSRTRKGSRPLRQPRAHAVGELPARGRRRDRDEVDTRAGLAPTGRSRRAGTARTDSATRPRARPGRRSARPGEGKICARELFAGAFARYAGVASARVDAPDGTVLTPVFGRLHLRVPSHRGSESTRTARRTTTSRSRPCR